MRHGATALMLTLLLLTLAACQGAATTTPPATDAPRAAASPAPTGTPPQTATPATTSRPANTLELPAEREPEARTTPALLPNNPRAEPGTATVDPEPGKTTPANRPTAEQPECLPGDVTTEGRPQSIFEVLGQDKTDEIAQAIACLSDEEIVRVLILPGINPKTPLPRQQADCIAGAGTGGMIRSSLTLADDPTALDAAGFAVIAHLTLSAADCVTPEQYEDLFLPGTELDRLMCIVPTAKEAEELFAAILEAGQQPLNVAIDEAQACLLQFPPEPLIEPLPNCTDEQREAGLPCRID